MIKELNRTFIYATVVAHAEHAMIFTTIKSLTYKKWILCYGHKHLRFSAKKTHAACLRAIPLRTFNRTNKGIMSQPVIDQLI